MAASGKPRKMRLDALLVEQSLAPSREQAKLLIMAGKVRHGTEVLDKPGKTYPSDLELTVIQPPRFVSRGGEKMAGFLDNYPMDVTGWHILDVGASTGGFTDCLLQAGAKDATCVDVGHGQLHYKLRQDPRVTNFERVNARQLDEMELPYPTYDLVVMDLSFISLTLILGPAWNRVRPDGYLVALVKPQFEAGKKEVDMGHGIIRDPAIHEAVIEKIRTFAEQHMPWSELIGQCDSPIEGMDGNREFLLGWKKVASDDDVVQIAPVA
ncbi:MAG: 23S rRNA (cytidine1920-2'-O)/16S rRNA (cytidine1409-2'-O)-methyltransferase [Puniceicoccaceae bacterium 5H]|nr:MAG: 23S rRNA (cytidine1920-2'-O)/16S rRNA (cytidine1409-2'-O)-methyltransferase [Puniceicoccaceae bacterium 5H]